MASLEERIKVLEDKVDELETQVCALLEGEEGDDEEDDLVADEEE